MAHQDTQRHRDLVRTLFEDCINSGNLERLPDFIAENYVGPNGEHGPAGFAGTIGGLRSSFPDIHFVIEDLIVEGDRVALRFHWEGTHQHDFRGFQATGKRVTSQGLAIYQLTAGKIARAWLQTDRLGFLEALGALPEELTTRLRGAPPNPSPPPPRQ